MTNLRSIGAQIALQRKAMRLTQAELAQRAQVSRSTVAALETGRTAELGLSKVAALLRVVGLELRVGPATRGRPTLEDLVREDPT